jgi:hypothetical protein
VWFHYHPLRAQVISVLCDAVEAQAAHAAEVEAAAEAAAAAAAALLPDAIPRVPPPGPQQPPPRLEPLAVVRLYTAARLLHEVAVDSPKVLSHSVQRFGSVLTDHLRPGVLEAVLPQDDPLCWHTLRLLDRLARFTKLEYIRGGV